MYPTAWIITCSVCSNKFSIERQRLLSIGATIVCPVCDNINSTQKAILGPSDGILPFPDFEKTLPSSNEVIQNFVPRKALPQKALLPTTSIQNHKIIETSLSAEEIAEIKSKKNHDVLQSVNDCVNNNIDEESEPEQRLGRPVRPVAIKTVVLPHEKKNQVEHQLESTETLAQTQKNNVYKDGEQNKKSFFSKFKTNTEKDKEDSALKERLGAKLKQAALEREREKLERQGFEVITESPFSTIKKEKNSLALKFAFSINLVVCAVFLTIVFKEELLINPFINNFANNICKKTNCTVPVPKSSKSFILEDSNFEQVAPNVLKFELSLKNSNQIALLAPSIEVAFQDSIGNTVAKSKFTASQWSTEKIIGANNSTKQTLFLNVDTSKIDNFKVKIVD